MTIRVYNDKKEKLTSYEAALNMNGANIYAFGETKKDALSNLRNRVERIIAGLQAVDYGAAVEVDARGDVIK